MANCPRCNMFLAPGAQFCPNCQLNLLQFSYQQQQPQNFAPPIQGSEVGETKKELVYKKILIILCFFMMGELIINHVSDWLGDWMYSITRYLRYLIDIAWAGLPLLISLMLAKKTQVRVVLIVLSSIYAVVALYYWFYYQFMYFGWGDYDSGYY